MVSVTCKNTAHLSSGEITVCNNNRMLLSGVNNEVKKDRHCALDAGAVVVKLKNSEAMQLLQ